MSRYTIGWVSKRWHVYAADDPSRIGIAWFDTLHEAEQFVITESERREVEEWLAGQ